MRGITTGLNLFICNLIFVLLLITGTGCGNSGNSTSSSTQTFAVTASASDGGSITPSRVEVESGSRASFTVTPDPGYNVESVTGCGGTLTDTVYTTGEITADCTVNALFLTAGMVDKEFILTLPGPDVTAVSEFTATLLVTANTDTSGTVSFGGNDTPFTVSGGITREITLPVSAFITNNNTVESKGVSVTSSLPVNVHVMTYATGSTDGFLVMPVSYLGTTYRVMSYGSTTVSNAYSKFAVVGTRNGTTVNITPSVSVGTYSAGILFSITLDAGETYMLNGDSLTDLTGSLIQADMPVAVFSGHGCATVPDSESSCDYIMEQMPPVSSWGTSHITVPHSGRTGGDLIRVLASEDGTMVIINGAAAPTLDAGVYYDQTLAAAAEIQSSKPVLVAQFMQSYEVDNEGDPAMTLIAAKSQYLTGCAFHQYDMPDGNDWMGINIVTETSELGSLIINGTGVNTALFSSIGDGTYSTAQIPLDPGNQLVTGSGSSFITVYGIDSTNAAAYSYPACRGNN